MATLLSAQVVTKEIDLTTIVPGVASTEGAIAGQFGWGPVNYPTLIDSENELVVTFSTPDNTNAEDWWSAANFLAYANKLYVVRVVDETNANTALRATNACSGNDNGFLVRNDNEFATKYNNGELKTTYTTGEWIARYAGVKGNSLKVSVCSSASAYQSDGTGLITVAAGSKTVAGVGTAFSSELIPGDLLVISGEVHKVASITDATTLTLVTAHVAGATSVTFKRRWEYYNYVDSAPGTSEDTAAMGGENDEMHIVVVDEDGVWTKEKNTVLEVFQFASKASDAKTRNGESSYYKEKLNRSRYVRWAGHSSTIPSLGSSKTTEFVDYDLPINYSLIGGNDGTAVSDDEKVRGYNLFKSSEDIDISFVIGSNASTTLAIHIINNIVEDRKDCVAFFSPPKSYVVNSDGMEMDNCVTFRNQLPSTSYAVLDNNWKYQYDVYNDVYRYIPLNGDIAGLHAKTDVDRDAWWAAAGLNRGHVKNVIKLAWNPRLADRDLLYKNGINPVVSFPGEGPVLYGNKTMQTKPSAFDRINVRRLFIVLRKSIAKAAQYSLFEFNDEFTRSQFRNLVEPYLRDVQGRRGVYDFLVKCDGDNNTPEIIDRNEFKADIYIKPARTAEFITLNFIATRTGVAFDEVVGRTGV